MPNKLFSLFIYIFIISSCQSTKFSGDITDLKGNVCRSMQGKGRILVAGRKQVFSFRTLYMPEELKYSVDFTFPVYGTENVNLEYIPENIEKGMSPFNIESSFEKRLLREKESANPELISNFLEIWAEYFEELLVSDNLINMNYANKFKWNKEADKLVSKIERDKHLSVIEFKYPSSDGYYERMDILVRDVINAEEIILHLIVRKCLEKETEALN
tara:strand:+ start:73155 stop:73799 length:645 start_codon:yes stop_codon:yes gene_type:complete